MSRVSWLNFLTKTPASSVETFGHTRKGPIKKCEQPEEVRTWGRGRGECSLLKDRVKYIKFTVFQLTQSLCNVVNFGNCSQVFFLPTVLFYPESSFFTLMILTVYFLLRWALLETYPTTIFVHCYSDRSRETSVRELEGVVTAVEDKADGFIFTVCQ